jgi:hypothetical protein
MLGKEYSINEIIYGIIFLLLLFYFTKSYNINLLQFLLIILVIISIIYISYKKKEELVNLQKDTQLYSTNSKSLLTFIDEIQYFKLYNPPLYKDFMNKIDNYIKLQKFINIHEKENYKLYPEKILQENLQYQKKDIIETFITFEHTLDDRITSVYKLNDLTKELNQILSKSKLIM